MGAYMTENHKPQQDFVRELIVDKPVNKKRLLTKLGISALCGLVFALTASLIFFIFYQVVIRPSQNRSVLAEAETETEELSLVEAETETENTEAQEAVQELQQPASVEVSLSIEDYQKLQNELYEIGEAANHSIVSITSTSSKTDWFNNSYDRSDLSSGVIISETDTEYLILTEHSFLPDEERLTVTFVDETSVDAYLKGADLNTGIAIVGVEKAKVAVKTRQKLTVAEIGNAALVRNGQIVIALGSPMGSGFSILTGNLTSKDSQITKWDNSYSILTTDIIGNQGSNGVLVDVSGKVIGLVMQEYNTSSMENILTAVAVSDLSDLIILLEEGKQVPYLGCYLTGVTDKIADAYEIPKGLYVSEVAIDSPAMLGSIQSGDVITAINGTSVSGMYAFSRQLLSMEPGDTCTITVSRQNGEEYVDVTCEVTLGVYQ